MHPIAFTIGSYPVHWYGILVALGFLVGLWTAGRRAQRVGISSEVIIDLGPWLIIGAVIGARILYVTSYWNEEFAGRPFYEVFMVQHGGLVFYGGLIGASLGYLLYARLKKLPVWKAADILAPSIALGEAFGRIGCLLNGCCYGRPTNLPWAIHFPPGSQYYPQGVHPTEIYASLLNLTLCIVLAQLFRRRKFDGQIFAFYLIGYALQRSFVECFRGDYPHYYFGWVTPAQLVSIPILLGGIFLLWKLPRKLQQIQESNA